MSYFQLRYYSIREFQFCVLLRGQKITWPYSLIADTLHLTHLWETWERNLWALMMKIPTNQCYLFCFAKYFGFFISFIKFLVRLLLHRFERITFGVWQILVFVYFQKCNLFLESQEIFLYYVLWRYGLDTNWSGWIYLFFISSFHNYYVANFCRKTNPYI